MFSKHRVEALSDGVFAIAMTLLILDIKVPLGNTEPLPAALKHDAASWISFAISFLLAGTFWMHQHRVLDVAAAWSKRNLMMTFVFLAFVCTLPFSTSLWGHHLRDPFALRIYFLNQFALALLLLVQSIILAAEKNVATPAALAEARFMLIAFVIGFGLGALLVHLPTDRVVFVPPFVILLARGIRRRFVRAPKEAKKQTA